MQEIWIQKGESKMKVTKAIPILETVLPKIWVVGKGRGEEKGEEGREGKGQEGRGDEGREGEERDSKEGIENKQKDYRIVYPTA